MTDLSILFLNENGKHFRIINAFTIMRAIANIIRKVAEQASKLVLFGALVTGVGLTSYATETAVGPTIEKAQLETVEINLEAVVEAINKVDPEWVANLPVLTQSYVSIPRLTYDWYYHGDDDPENFNNPANWSRSSNPAYTCGGTEDIPCSMNQPYDNITDLKTNVLDLHEEEDIFLVADRADYVN